jgi:regulator of PEP synthase PpsR (kinase-PPPase family)
MIMRKVVRRNNWYFVDTKFGSVIERAARIIAATA